MTLAAPTPVRARGDGLAPETIEAAGHEHRRPLEVELGLEPPNALGRSLRELHAEPLDELAWRLDGNEIRLGEVAVVVRLLLRAPRTERAARGVEVVRLLLDLPPALPDADLPLDLRLDSARDEVERVHVLDLGARPELVGPLRSDGHIGVHAQGALLHLRVRDPELDDRLPQELEEPLRVVGAADVGSGHDLDERRPATVVVHERVVGSADPSAAAADVDRLRRVLLQVSADDSYRISAFCSRY